MNCNFVTHKVAQSLKMLGYKQKTDALYINGVLIHAPSNSTSPVGECIPAPTKAQVCEWLREEKDVVIFLDVIWERNSDMKITRRYSYNIAYSDGRGFCSCKYEANYHNVLTAAIENAINYLINISGQ